MGCTNTSNTNKIVEKPIIDSSAIFKQEAVITLDSATDFIKQGILGKISPKVANEKSQPFLDKFNYYMSKMNPQDTLYVHNYRLKELNKVIDLQIEQDIKKGITN